VLCFQLFLLFLLSLFSSFVSIDLGVDRKQERLLQREFLAGGTFTFMIIVVASNFLSFFKSLGPILSHLGVDLRLGQASD
jgi:hypothetical protein